jgi:hypothetical protein
VRGRLRALRRRARLAQIMGFFLAFLHKLSPPQLTRRLARSYPPTPRDCVCFTHLTRRYSRAPRTSHAVQTTYACSQEHATMATATTSLLDLIGAGLLQAGNKVMVRDIEGELTPQGTIISTTERGILCTPFYTFYTSYTYIFIPLPIQFH